MNGIGRRWHDQKLGFRLNVRKFAFRNRVVNDWNSLSSECVGGDCCTVNTFRNILQLYWNQKLLNYVSCVLFEIVHVGVRRLSLCLLMSAVSSTRLQWNRWNTHSSWDVERLWWDHLRLIRRTWQSHYTIFWWLPRFVFVPPYFRSYAANCKVQSSSILVIATLLTCL